MPITIDILKNHPESISTLAQQWLLTIGKWEPDASHEDIKKWLHEWLNESTPMAFVAFDSDHPIGMCSLQFNDGLPSTLMPWLGDLFVFPEYQRRKISVQLMEAAKYQAKLQGFHSLYLFAPDQTIPNYYMRLGWQKMSEDRYNGQVVTVMSCEL
ncbi:MAG: GNAT family N-acetyltransferase [Candidatus Babeliales bacterium]|uniref:Acetyltransferase (GNAT) family protein n=1 Tax=Candidatus Berkiella aquae TaxID=295108 RepID=A0A0Q9YKC7_9GAMM|nr:GNAT family N-acetyltransferase [Candidatus Berkiella aquae]MCS5712846.1 GNAT family N-acetyltransferase [Candidatus Berkiella aquae]